MKCYFYAPYFYRKMHCITCLKRLRSSLKGLQSELKKL